MFRALSDQEIAEALQDLSGWQYQEDKIKKTYEFSNFQEAIGFIVRLSFPAEKYDHHPELFNVYNKVEIALTTHDAGNRVTAKDITLAHAIDAIT